MCSSDLPRQEAVVKGITPSQPAPTPPAPAAAATAAAPAERDGATPDGDPLAGIAENRRVAQARQVGLLVAERAKANAAAP